MALGATASNTDCVNNEHTLLDNRVGFFVGDTVGLAVGADIVGLDVGPRVGLSVGGPGDGGFVGFLEGGEVGVLVGGGFAGVKSHSANGFHHWVPQQIITVE